MWDGNFDYATLRVGDKVGVARTGSWDVHSEGIYTVVKINKVKVTVQRASDQYERVFSVKRRCEMGTVDRYRAAYLERVEDQQMRNESQDKKREVRAAWNDIEQAAHDKNISALRRAIVKLELLNCVKLS